MHSSFTAKHVDGVYGQKYLIFPLKTEAVVYDLMIRIFRYILLGKKNGPSPKWLNIKLLVVFTTKLWSEN